MESDEELCFDIETNPIPRVTRSWCAVATNLKTMVEDAYVGEDEICGKLIPRLQRAKRLIGHNLLGFDLPTLERLYNVVIPRTDANGDFKIMDTLILSRALYPERMLTGEQAPHSLRAWGDTIGSAKDDFHDFSQFTPEMLQYNRQDVRLNVRLWLEHILPRARLFPEAVDLESRIAEVTAEQERNGFMLDVPAAIALADEFESELVKLRADVLTAFPPLVIHGEYVTARSTTKAGHVKGAVYRKVTFKKFNPNSRPQIAERLIAKYNWTPAVKTKTGKPKVSGAILGDLPWSEAQQFAALFDTQKKLSMIRGKTDDKGWLAYVGPDGRVHGEVTTCGTLTNRMSHARPNVGQVNKKDKRMRNAWCAPPDKKLVGADAKALEFRALAHDTAPYDGGNLANVVVNGDLHQLNADLLGLKSGKAREIAKRYIYALVYGARDPMLGSIVRLDSYSGGYELTDSDKTLGARSRAILEKGLTGLGEVVEKVSREAALGYVTGLDGRQIKIRREYSALNFRLQSSGAIVMKRAAVIWREWLRCSDLERIAKLVATVHDEFVVEAEPDYAEMIGESLCNAITAAGLYYKMAVPMEGEYKIGQTWGDIH